MYAAPNITIAAGRFDRKDRRHALVMLERGRLHAAMGQRAEAESDLTGAVAALRAQEEPARLAEALCALAELHDSAGNIDAARRVLDEAAALRRKIMPASHPALAAIQRQLSELTAPERVTK